MSHYRTVCSTVYARGGFGELRARAHAAAMLDEEMVALAGAGEVTAVEHHARSVLELRVTAGLLHLLRLPCQALPIRAATDLGQTAYGRVDVAVPLREVPTPSPSPPSHNPPSSPPRLSPLWPLAPPGGFRRRWREGWTCRRGSRPGRRRHQGSLPTPSRLAQPCASAAATALRHTAQPPPRSRGPAARCPQPARSSTGAAAQPLLRV